MDQDPDIDQETATWAQDNQFSVRCSGNDVFHHPIEDVDLRRNKDGKLRTGKCCLCSKEFQSRIRGQGWSG